MKCVSVIRLLVVFAISIACMEGAFACQCGVGFRERNAWENAQRAEQSETAIFEGTPIKFELRWSVLTAKEGELIPADTWSGRLDYLREPNMVVTFRVSRLYKGSLESEVQLHTGLGGGDCAAVYAPGLNYLVYAGGPSLDRLSVSMCSPGGWIDGGAVAADLRYLRKERPTSTDLTPIKRWSQRDFATEEARQKKDYEDRRRRLDVATGKICGTLVHRNPNDSSEGSIAFLSTLGYSPFWPSFGEVKGDGSFCSPNLGPGKYYLYFVSVSEKGRSAVYYPGVADIAKAVPVEVSAGQTQSNIAFKVETQSAYSVRGIISADETPKFGNEGPTSDVTVLLIRPDGDRRVWYYEKAFFISNLGYFKFDNVIPGRYYACVQTPGPGWMTTKVEVDVTTHMKFISLDLVHKK